MKRIAIIPARGGSKRIPRKNIKEFLGKPIIAYSISAALESNMFEEVIVSTDDKEIAEIAVKYGAKVPFLRSFENSQDHSTTIDVIKEVLNWYTQLECYFDQVTCIYPCSPFVTRELIVESYDLLIDPVDVVFPAIAYGHPIQRAFTLDENNYINLFFDNDIQKGTQFFQKCFHDAGMFYTFDIKSILKSNSLRTENTKAIQISELKAQDIDNLDDWKLAELKFKMFIDESI
jgi:pseudaminic acid cytidylyltransferase